MRLTPRVPVINQNDGFNPEMDIFEYAEFGDRFANLVCSLEQPLTFLLDGPWGSGKSVFIRQWAGHLRNRGVAVVEFNAFANDHHEDAFIALAAEIVGLAKKHLGSDEPNVRGVLSNAKKVGAALMPTAARIGIRAGTLGLINLDDLADAGDAVKALAKELGDEAAKATERAISNRLKTAHEERLVLDSFRDRLAEVAHALAADAVTKGMAQDHELINPEATDAHIKQYPVVFIVDELDRCRPSFAISLLERIKHLFSVNGVTFVLVTNLEQLRAAVRGAYGQDTDGRLYLEKFYDLRVTLPPSQEHSRPTASRYVRYLWTEMELNSGDGRVDDLVQREVVNLAEAHSLSLRTLERVATHVALTYAAAGPQGLKLAPLIAGLAVIRQVNANLYTKARRGQLSWSDVQQFYRFDDWPEEEREWSTGWWRFFTDHAMTDVEMDKFRPIFYKFAFHDRFDLVPWGTRQIDGFRVAEAPE